MATKEEIRFEDSLWWGERLFKVADGFQALPDSQNPDDWVINSAEAFGLVKDRIPSHMSRILVVGAGISSLAPRLFQAGYKCLVCVDFCSTVIKYMELHHPDMKWIEADATDMRCFEDAQFDVVVDKGLMDVVRCYGGRGAGAARAQMTSEVHRCLVPGGSYICLSSLAPPEVCDFIGIKLEDEGEIISQQSVFQLQNDCWTATFEVSTNPNAGGDSELVTLVTAAKNEHSEMAMGKWREYYIEKHKPARDYDYSDEEVEDMKDIFRAMYNSEPEMCDKYLKKEYWEALSDGLHMSQNPISTMAGLPQRPRWRNKDDISKAASQGSVETKPDTATYLETMQCLDRSGYFLLDASQVGWDDPALADKGGKEGRVPFDRIVRTVERLVHHGWPSCFAMLYDEYWHVIYELYDVVGPFLDEHGDDVVLEMDCFLWAIQRQKELYGKGKMQWKDEDNSVCGNFGTPHRDAGFDDCNTDDGTPEKLSVWVPLTDCTNDNGCMYVLPKEADPLFEDYDHKWHMSASRKVDGGTLLRFDVSRARPLICPRGSVNSWQGNLIHWGSSCGAYAKQPRMSLAMTLRKPGTDDDKSNSVCGRAPLTRQQLHQLTPKARLSIVGKAVIMYSHWFSVLKMDYEKMERGVKDLPIPDIPAGKGFPL